MKRGGRVGGGQAGHTLLLLGVMAALLAGSLVMAAFGQALGGKGKHQRAADLAAMSAARAMRTAYPRLFEPAFLAPGVPNPEHLPELRYRALGKAAAVRAAQRNGVHLAAADVTYPGAGFGPTRVSVALRGEGRVRVPGRRGPTAIPVSARASAEFVPSTDATLGQPAQASGGGYDGPLAYRMGKPMRPDTAAAFDRLAAAARRAGIELSITSGFRSDAEQAKLFAAHPDPKWVAPPGKSLHRLGTELDLGPPGAYGWLAGERPPLRLREALRLGAVALRPRRSTPARRPPRRPTRTAGGRQAATRRTPNTGCRASCPPASTTTSRGPRCAGTCR